MAIVCAVFLADALAVALAAFSVVSTCIGVVGLLPYWGASLDPITVAAICLSIGYAVSVLKTKRIKGRLQFAKHCRAFRSTLPRISPIICSAQVRLSRPNCICAFEAEILGNGGSILAVDDVERADRLRCTLGAVGFPIIQAGFSTILCVSTLLIAGLWMGKVRRTRKRASVWLTIEHKRSAMFSQISSNRTHFRFLFFVCRSAFSRRSYTRFS